MANHEELIRSGSFDTKFKNALRDYYSYGFMSFGELGKTLSKDGEKAASATTMNEDWTRLNNILGDYFKWSADKSTSLFASTDSRLLYENPFHRIYRFCRYNSNDPIAFFSIVFALSEKVSLKDGTDSLELPETVDYEDFSRLEEDIKRHNPLLSSQLQCFYSDNKDKLFSGDNNAINAKLKELVNMGIVEDKAEKSGKRTNHRWSLTGLYLSDIIKKGEEAHPDFYLHFTAALEFFSKYYFLGEVGGFILSRLKTAPQRVFRVKHEYFAAALNDCNLYDLLYAIENKRWVKISYRNGLSGVSTRLVCYPIEIRISSVNGREYLTFYEPFVRNYSNLRLEFVDSVEYIRENTIEWQGRVISLEDKWVKADLKKAAELIKHSWGAATLGADTLNDNIPLSRVSFKIKYDPKSEGYIPARLNREKRQGTVKKKSGQLDFTVNVLNSTELQPWVRSFYSRLYDYKEDSDFSVKDDVDAIISQMEDPRLYYEKPKKRTARAWAIPSDCKYKTEPKPAYSLLFNEVFGIYYSLIGEILMNIYSDNSGIQSFSQERLDTIIKDTLKAHKGEMGVWTEANLRKEIKPLLQSELSVFMRKGEQIASKKVGGSEDIWYKTAPQWLVNKSAKSDLALESSYRPKYSASCDSFGRDICPLTKVEARWLLTILNDPKADLFFTSKEKEAVIRHIGIKDYSPFKASSVIYFDRYCKETDFDKEREILINLLTAVRNHRVIEASYISMRGNIVEGSFMPLTVEYSKRDDVFRIFSLPCNGSSVFTMNLNGIKALTVTEVTFDFEEAMEELDSFFSNNKTEITVEFYDSRNLTDRILSEFSPWEKQCLYNKESELYTLTIYYQKTDELEMVIRLMGYGNEIVIRDKNHPIALEIKRRLYKQREIEGEKIS